MKIKHANTKYILTISLIIVGRSILFAQHDDHFSNYHKVTGMLGYSLVDNGFTPETNELLVVPTFGINYDYFFHEKWGAGAHTDVLVQQFTVESHDGHEQIIRDNPVAICAMLIFKPNHHWGFLGGYGIEIEKHENLSMIRLGTEYEIAIQNQWEIGFTVEYDYKFKAYGSLVFGVGFSKLIGIDKKHHY